MKYKVQRLDLTLGTYLGVTSPGKYDHHDVYIVYLKIDKTIGRVPNSKDITLHEKLEG